MSSTEMPEDQGGGAASDPETDDERREREERERAEQAERPQQEELRPASEDDEGAGQGSAGGAV